MRGAFIKAERPDAFQPDMNAEHAADMGQGRPQAGTLSLI
jgi:hypothetical protein